MRIWVSVKQAVGGNLDAYLVLSICSVLQKSETIHITQFPSNKQQNRYSLFAIIKKNANITDSGCSVYLLYVLVFCVVLWSLIYRINLHVHHFRITLGLCNQLKNTPAHVSTYWFFPHLLLYPIFIHQDFRLKFKWMQMETAEHGTSNTEVDETERAYELMRIEPSQIHLIFHNSVLFIFSNSKLIFSWFLFSLNCAVLFKLLN